MPITALGQIWTPKNSAEIRDQLLRDLRLGAIDAGIADPPVQPGTDWFLLSTAVANICLIGFANVSIGLDAQNVLTATGDDLEQIRIALGLPEVPPSPSSGKIKIRVDGSVTVVDGTQFLLPNGKRGKTVGTVINPADGDELNVICIDTGTETNLPSGEIVRFTAPPVNLETNATVSEGAPLTGGTDSESPDRKRDRILNTLRNKPAGGNWSQIREQALEALGSLVDCYVFPALGGPGSAKVVPVKDFDPSNRDFSRAVSTAALTTVQGSVQSQMPTPQEIVFQAASDLAVDVALKVTLPASQLSGGNGLGWTDSSPWPPLVGGDSGRVSVSASSANDTITVTAQTTTAPIDGQTHVAWWSTVDRKFTVALVLSHSGSSGGWVLTLDRALVSTDGTGPQASDLVSPAATNLDLYATAWVNLFRSLGPGENTTDTNRLPRALRHPFVVSEDPSSLTATTLASFVKQFSEITDYATSYAPTTAPTVPGTVSSAPQILVPQRFAIYQQ